MQRSRSEKKLIMLIVAYTMYRLNIQSLLYGLAFLSYGVGDAITGAYMMDIFGPEREANPLARFVFSNQGWQGLLALKIWFTLMILLGVHIVQKESKNAYWIVNGFLASLSVAGILAINANIAAIEGEPTPSPIIIIFAFITLMIILTTIGEIIDRNHTRRLKFNMKKGHTSPEIRDGKSVVESNEEESSFYEN